MIIQWEPVNLIAAIVILGCFVFSGVLIWWYMQKYEQVELFIIAYVLALAVCLSVAFL